MDMGCGNIKMVTMSECKLTVGLPTWNNRDIVWLPMEGLCRQVVDVPWELIVLECQSDNFVGEDFFMSYFNRLKKVGCINITYLYSLQRLMLSRKWKMISDKAAGEYFVFQGSDDYPPPERLQAVWDIQSEWYSCRHYYAYHLGLRKLIEYDNGQKHPLPANWRAGYNIAVRAECLERVPLLDKYKNIDNFVKRSVNPMQIYIDQNKYAGVSTTGANTLTTKRGRSFVNTRNWRKEFRSTNKTIDTIGLPGEVIKKLKKYEGNSLYPRS